ncbi:MAG TPA: hypothetical protein VN426_03140 [Syntrophomonadaceae bacterium]|nr:hypothetical protein [Syntrophomonadaceae bacterium]
MKKSTGVLLATGLIIASTGLGCLLGKAYNKMHNVSGDQKPVLSVEEKPHLIEADTQVVFEQEYTKCEHVIIAAFPQRDQLNGRSLQEVQQSYPAEKGYQISWQGKTLVIHQKTEDWCPKDKGKLRLKAYQNKVAVYQGPDAEHDILLKVTRIPLASLPSDIQKSITDSKLEFYTQEDLNDALENLDEYL